MLKVRLAVVAAIAIMVTGLFAIGLIIWKNQASRSGDRSVRGVSSKYPAASSGSSASSSGSLLVESSSGVDSLGQITPDSGSTHNQTRERTPALPAIDPSTFDQYEKYKDGNAALFGEIQVGSGVELTAGKQAAVYYKGWLTDGQLFDMTRTDQDGKLQPFLFTMGAQQVIPGWEQGMLGMKVGGKRLIIVPPAVGYGEAGHGPIPGNAVLVFQVELLAVE